MGRLRRRLQTTALGRWLLVPYRLRVASAYHLKPLVRVVPWLFKSREPTDFTYELTDVNASYLAEFLHVVTGIPSVDIARYMDELADDDQLWTHVREMTLRSPERHISDVDPPPGRRVAWYALARATKPRVVVEGGIDKGLGTCILAAALARNAAEGRPGYVYGVDNVAGKGYLFGAPYDTYGEVVIGDLCHYLETASEEVDMFLQEASRLASFEREVYRLIAPKVTPDALVGAAWPSRPLLDFARETQRRCLAFATEPKDHWYPGERIAIAFKSMPDTGQPPSRPA